MRGHPRLSNKASRGPLGRHVLKPLHLRQVDYIIVLTPRGLRKLVSYAQRLATSSDANSLAPLWHAFAIEREKSDSSMRIKPNFDFTKYVFHQLKKPLSFCYVLQHEQQIVGFISIYFYDEAPPTHFKSEFEILENPFITRRVGAVLGLYVEKQHQHLSAIKLLIEAALQKAEEMQVNDIDLLVSSEQTGLYALLKRYKFTESAIQLTKHYDVYGDDLPSLHLASEESLSIDFAVNQSIPLRDPLTNEIVTVLNGEAIHLEPLRDGTGNIIKSSRGLTVYPLPLRDPQTQNWVFDESGMIVFCPLLRDENGEIVERDGYPQYQSPVYEYESGKLVLKRDQYGNYCFA